MIVSITVAVAVVGIVLILVLIAQLYSMNSEDRLKKFRSNDEGLADLLNYAAVCDDGVIVCKNGSFIASWLYRGADNASATDTERELISFRINQALVRLGNGWMIHVDAVRRPAPSYSERGQSHFRDRVSQAVDDERRSLFESLGTMYEGFFVITVTWFPPLLAEQKFVELMFDDDADKPSRNRQTQLLIEHFQRECKNLESRLSSAVELERLAGRQVMQEDSTVVTHDQQLQWLQFCVTGLNHPVQLPNVPVYIDCLVGGQEFYTGVVPKIGRMFIQAVSIDGYPPESWPGILASLAELPVDYRWSNRFIFLDQHEAIAELEKFRKRWKQKIRGFFDQVFNTNSGNIDQDAQSMVVDASEAIAETNSGLVSQGYLTSVVILMGEDRQLVEESARKIEKAIQARGFSARVESINTVEAFLGSLPGHGVENVRRPLINSLNLSDLIPTSSTWTGDAMCPCPYFPSQSPAWMHCVTSGQTPFRFNTHRADLGHALMIGPTRAGKSTHLGLLALQFRRYEGARIFVFDKGLSMYPACRAAGGRHYTIAADDDRLAFAPLADLSSKTRRAWAMEWIDSLLALNGVITSPAQRNEIGSAIVNMSGSGSKTITDFTLTVQDEAIRSALRQYTVDGLMGHLIDAPEDGLRVSDFMCFEMEKLMGMGEKFLLPVLLYLFMRIEESLDGRPTIIILDEAWLYLVHPTFKAKLKEWLKTLAKKNVAVIMATQNLTDASKSDILDVIVESTACKIFLPNHFARDKETAELYTRMGLNARQIEILATAVPKRDYYYVSERGRRLYQLALGPIALAFVGATDQDSINAMIDLEKRYGDEWVDQWLKSRGLTIPRQESLGVAA